MSTTPNVPFNNALTHPTRSQVFTALFNYMQQVPPPLNQSWRTFSQYYKNPEDISASQQPWMCLVRGAQEYEQQHAYGVPKITWKCLIVAYYRVEGYTMPNFYPDLVTDPLLDSIERLFQTDPMTGRLTLGGLVQNCWINGPILAEPGLVDGQAILVVPISIFL